MAPDHRPCSESLRRTGCCVVPVAKRRTVATRGCRSVGVHAVDQEVARRVGRRCGESGSGDDLPI